MTIEKKSGKAKHNQSDKKQKQKQNQGKRKLDVYLLTEATRLKRKIPDCQKWIGANF